MDKLFPLDWYWLADDGRLYSSRQQCLIDDSDSQYVEWLASERSPTRWPEDAAAEQTNTSLLSVIGAYGLVIGENPLDGAKQNRIAALSADCARAIVGGFESDALGAVHTYPSDIKDQLNLMGSVTDSIVPGLPEDWKTPFWVSDASGAWSFKLHDADQIQKAGRDGKAHVVSCQAKLEELTSSVASADSLEAVNEVIWPGA